MTAPTAPFSSTKQIAYLMLGMFQNADQIGDPDFTSTGVPSPTIVTALRTMKSAEVQMEFAAVGYKIPFQELSGESWPDFQTNFLALLEATGVASQITYSKLPSPGMSASPRASGLSNVYREMYEDWRKRIRESGCGLRAAYYPMSRAEKWIGDPRAPQTDYSMSSDTRDPAKFGLLLENLRVLEEQFEDIADMNLDWDFAFTIRED